MLFRSSSNHRPGYTLLRPETWWYCKTSTFPVNFKELNDLLTERYTYSDATVTHTTPYKELPSKKSQELKTHLTEHTHGPSSRGPPLHGLFWLNFASCVHVLDHEGVLQSLQEWHQRLRQPRIDKGEASKQPCQDISSSSPRRSPREAPQLGS